MFHGVTDDTLSRAAGLLGDPETAARLRLQALATYERIGAQWWRDRLAAWTPPTPESPPGSRRIRLHPVPGGLWLVGPEQLAVQLTPLRGFGYLRELLRRPGQAVAAIDLVTAGTGTVVAPGLGEVLDKQALTAYRQRLADLERELAEARDWSDLGRIDTVRAERDALLDELGRATGLGGRARPTGSTEERARVAVKKAVSAAVARIATVDEPLACHLRAAIHTGMTCSYEPIADAELEWVLG